MGLFQSFKNFFENEEPIFTCSKCGEKTKQWYDMRKFEDDVYYCKACWESIPTCDKCKYHYHNAYYPRYGSCAYYNAYLLSYDTDECEHYQKGSQVHPDVIID